MAKSINTSFSFVAGAKVIRLQLEPLAIDPTGAELIAGRMWYNTASNQGKYFDGTNVVPFPAGSSSTDITVTPAPTQVGVQSGSGTVGNIPVADGTNAGVMSPADKTKLDNLSNIAGQNVGTVATSAALDALTDTADGSTAVENGDWAILTADEGGREAGIYFHNGTSWPATPGYQFPDSVVAASDTAAGIVELATDPETVTGTATNLAVTPAGVTAAIEGRTFSAQYGDATTGPFVIPHGLSSADLLVTHTNASGLVDVDFTVDATNITITPLAAVAANEYTVRAIRI